MSLVYIYIYIYIYGVTKKVLHLFDDQIHKKIYMKSNKIGYSKSDLYFYTLFPNEALSSLITDILGHVHSFG